jgi:hypothetical protein
VNNVWSEAIGGQSNKQTPNQVAQEFIGYPKWQTKEFRKREEPVFGRSGGLK